MSTLDLHDAVSTAAPILVPKPRRLSLSPGHAPASNPTIRRDPTLPPESYRLRISPRDPNPIVIESPSPLADRHALTTLSQLRTQYGDQLPALEIEDAPAFPIRGVMLDISRDRVPTMRQLFETVDLLDSLKYNHIQLYTEHTFAYAGHEEVWQGWSPMTPDEVRRLDEYSRDRGIELVANQNCFGHLAKWLTLPRYAPLAETHGPWMFDNAWPMSGPFSLCPTDPGSIALVQDLLSQLLPCIRSPLVNIGCDETFDIEFGRSKDECQKRGRAAVYAEFVARICRAVRDLGKRPMFWADIALSHPECLADLPEDLICLAWGYEPDAPFHTWSQAIRHVGRDAWVCPGTSTWRSITGRTTERRENLKASAGGGLAGGAKGFLVTDWGDTGHHQQWPLTLHALAQGAQAAWHGPDDLNTAEASSLHVLGDRTLKVGPWLDELGDTDLPLRDTCGKLSRPDRTRLRNQTAIFIDLLKSPTEQTDVGDPKDWESVRSRVHELTLRTPHGLGPQIDSELAHTSEVARFAADRGAWRRRPGGLSAEQREDLADRLEAMIADHRRTWLARSRSGGLESSCDHYAKMLAQIR